MSKIFYKTDDIKIINDDYLTSNYIQEEEIDLVVTSPPYNVDIKYNSYTDDIDYNTYLEFTEKWLDKTYKLLKSDGRFCLNIPLDKNKGGQQSVYADIVTIAKKIGFKYHSTIIWNEQYISRRTAWGSWLSASAPYVIAPVEMIVFYIRKNGRKQAEQKNQILPKKNFLNGQMVFGILWEKVKRELDIPHLSRLNSQEDVSSYLVM